jgi:hypothetical protein
LGCNCAISFKKKRRAGSLEPDAPLTDRLVLAQLEQGGRLLSALVSYGKSKNVRLIFAPAFGGNLNLKINRAMFKKLCPWCANKIYLSQLGNRPSSIKPKWFHITRRIQVCPYCANPVKLSGRGLYALLLLLPFLIALFFQLIFGKELIDISSYRPLLMLSGAFGIALAFLTATLVKETRL